MNNLRFWLSLLLGAFKSQFITVTDLSCQSFPDAEPRKLDRSPSQKQLRTTRTNKQL